MKTFVCLSTGFVLVSLAAGCGNVHKTASSGSLQLATVNSVDGAMSAVNGMLDDVSGDKLARAATRSKTAVALNLGQYLEKDARADVCSGRVETAPCDPTTLTRRLSYFSCTVGTSSATLSGSSQLQYSDIAPNTVCDIGQGPPFTAGESVTRTMDLVYIYPDSSRYELTSGSHIDFRNILFNGGSSLTSITEPGVFSLQIPGVRRIWTNALGQTLADLSIRNVGGLMVSGGLSRGARTLDSSGGGAIEVSNVISSVVTEIIPHALKWGDPGCCHPTSGSMTVSSIQYIGAFPSPTPTATVAAQPSPTPSASSSASSDLIGSYTVTYSSTCGNVTLQTGGQSLQTSISHCE